MILSQVLTKQGTVPVKAYLYNEAFLPSVVFDKWNQNHQVIEYAADFAVLDTETSHADLNAAWVYQWAVKWQGEYIYGRKPSEFICLLRRMQEQYQLHARRRLIFLVHNLSYDMQYLKRWLLQLGDLKILATDAHTFLIVDVAGFRFLCSYKLSNMSLQMFADTYAKEYRKAAGEIDYTVVRYQDQELTRADWEYMFSDVASQYDAISEYLKINGYDRMYKAPFTSTGFVRAVCRKAAAKSMNWHKKFLTGALTLEQYQLCRQAFMGGITICSWLYEGRTVRVGQDGVQKLGHKDFVSSYPARQMLDYMPTGKPFWWGEIRSREVFDTLLKTYCCVFLLHMKGVHVNAGVTAPYIPSSKCIGLDPKDKSVLKINGKIIEADEITIAVTEIDYKWIKAQYQADNFTVTDMLCFNRGKAPDWLRKTVMQYFELKCNTPKDTKEMAWVKGLLNAIYGMSATAICRQIWDFTDGRIVKAVTDSQKQLTHFYNSRNSFMPYQIGIYTTAWARNALMEMILCVGYDHFLYCDTDSVFYISTPEIEERLQRMNDRIEARAKAAGAFVGNKILGYAEDEPELTAFRGLHAKCYAVEEWDKKAQDYRLKVTIAGIPKYSIKWKEGKPVGMSNAEELKDIENLQDGFAFTHCGGTRTVYMEEEPHTEVINGHPTELSSCAIIENIEKTVSETMWVHGADYSILHIDQEVVL